MAGAARREYSLVRRWGRLLGLALAAAVAIGTEPVRAVEILGCRFESGAQLILRSRRQGWRMLDRTGRLMAGLGAYYGPPVPLKKLPAHLVAALVASEDQRFYEHGGVDFWSFGRALARKLESPWSRMQGASTLHTQTLKNTCFRDAPRDIWQKMNEFRVAEELEKALGKEGVVEVYLNSVFFGGRAYGIQAAARLYLDKYAHELTPLESALLVQLLPGPNLYNPFVAREKALERAYQVLDKMVDQGRLDRRTADRARRQGRELRLAPVQLGLPGYYPTSPGVGWLAEWARKEADALLPGHSGVVTVTTTLDAALQPIVERRLAQAFERHAAKAGFDQGAVVVLSPAGDILAMVGGRDFAASQFNAAERPNRQPGSAFKLFVYLAALEAGRRPGDIVEDTPLVLPSGIEIRNHDRQHLGAMTLAESFVRSRNTVAARLAMRRIPEIKTVAARLGITAPLADEVGLALGVSEVSLLELTAAYAAIANGGYRVTPTAVVQIRDNLENLAYCRERAAARRVVDAETLRMTRAMLAGVVRHPQGTGRAADPGFPVYGKTGTTNDNRDAWFVGFTDRLVVGVWLGNERPVPMRGVTGGGLPAEIFRAILQDAAKVKLLPQTGCEVPAEKRIARNGPMEPAAGPARTKPR